MKMDLTCDCCFDDIDSCDVCKKRLLPIDKINCVSLIEKTIHVCEGCFIPSNILIG